MAENEEQMMGISAPSERSIINTSKAKKMPVIGAWKMAANAAAPPMPMSMITCLYSNFSQRPMLEPMDAPVETEGPSKPTEPPKPTVKALATMVDHMLCLLTSPFFFLMAYKIPGMPCPISFFRINLQKQMVRKMPMAG